MVEISRDFLEKLLENTEECYNNEVSKNSEVSELATYYEKGIDDVLNLLSDEKTETIFAPKNNKEENKPDLSLLPFDVLCEDARAYEVGTKKYTRYSWMAGFKFSEMIAPALRHISAHFWYREPFDKESFDKYGIKVNHLAMARFCLACIIHSELVGNGLDDRPGGE